MKETKRNCILLLLFLYAAVHCLAVEPWSDPKLSVTNGLQLWLDASRQPLARQAKAGRPLLDGSTIDHWLDSSGAKRDLSQLVRESMPQFRVGGGVAWVGFDGRDDFMSASRLSLQWTNATIFLVAAPKSNAGFFRGFFACTQSSQNDYVRGLNIDLGPASSGRFEFLNIEFSGAGGARNLLNSSFDFGSFHILSILAGQGPAGLKVWIDGSAQGSRERSGSVIQADEIVLGGRLYSNSADLPFAQGFLDGNIAELIVFDRALSDSDREKVSSYLMEKYAELRAGGSNVAGTFNPLIPVAQPPPVQMFVPGFTTREIPLRLPNINCVKYRPDGKLMALAYNGHIYLLSDSNGDGLEDKAELFWETNSLRAPIGMALTPPGYALGQGAFVAAKGKIALIVDTNGDDKADREIIVAEGWKELSHGVDALGVAIDKEGNVYFGLGVENFTNPYLVDRATGASRFDLKSERGTILKVSPEFKKREILCTGIRFPVAMAFNRLGDLFSTDQEGATWLSNGNPLDELLHIQPGRHYGFPPRHPKFLPNVIDEPSTFDYAPQHQSTCGLNFNSSSSGRVFGPTWWADDAFVTGYSRGKLYRSTVIKTPEGYVADNQLIACLNMLPVDACVSPRGDLTVAVHSGQPDWGSGPNGEGKVYQVRYEFPDLPQPVRAWAESPTETAIAWDRPLTLDQARAIVRDVALTGGRYVAAGDRFESLRPGYQVVQDQLREQRQNLAVYGTQLSPDGRILFLRSERRTQPIKYALTLSSPLAKAAARGPKPLSQHPRVDLAYSLNGIQASWQPAIQGAGSETWLPSFDVSVTSNLLNATKVMDAWNESMQREGSLILRAQLDLRQMLRPAVQPGATIDYTWPKEEVVLRFTSPNPFVLRFNGRSENSRKSPTGRQEVSFKHTPGAESWSPVELRLPTPLTTHNFSLTWHTAEYARERPFPLHRILLPWASMQDTTNPTAQPTIAPEIAGANWLNGRRIFFGETAGCAKCHQIRGEGHRVGPDLSNLIHRDYASVLKDIVTPNAAINPDHVAYELEFKDGEALTAVLQRENEDSIVVASAGTLPLRIPKSRIQSLKASAKSLMPEGLSQSLAPGDLRDLMAFLLISPLDPATLATTPLIPPRPTQELQKIWKNVRFVPASTNRFRILLVAGPKDHGPDEHDYPLWQKRWEKLLPLAENVSVKTAFPWPSSSDFLQNDLIVFYSNNPGWNQERADELDQFQKRGGGLAYLHYAVDGHEAVDALSQRIGLAWRGGASKFRHGPLDLTFSPHPITQDLPPLKFYDESYWQLLGDKKGIQLVASGLEENVSQPLMWTRENGPGRVFVSIPGHYTWTFDDPAFRLLLLRGFCWAAHQPLDRLSELSFVGARLQPEAE
ncbi:MAG TPA: ThuA domain-containing protein [Candidatus Saccharimonadales bacterium]|nr:ThuA domain-containing protein [Candidatus Saccharimonadales bacterium]